MEFPNEIFSGYQAKSHLSCHCQGIAVDRERGYIYYSFTTRLVKSDLLGNIIGSVDGFIGHLGCIDFCERDGRVYGSLEYKNDSIGRDILGAVDRVGAELKNAFFCAIFEVDRIDRMNMNAEREGIMRAVYLPEVVADYEARVTVGGSTLCHRYGTSGIDGIGWGPAFGGGEERLAICYGVYGDTDRTDNDYQIILTFDAADWWQTLARPLDQANMHSSGALSEGKFFLKTGSTDWGVQNLEYDAYQRRWMLAVYRGKKPSFKNYDMFFVSADAEPFDSLHEAYGEPIRELPLLGGGVYFPYGSTGMYSFGDGRYYFSESKNDPQHGQCTTVRLYLAGDTAEMPFRAIEP